MFWVFSYKAYGILAPQSGIEPASLVLEGEVLTTGPPGRFQLVFFFFNQISMYIIIIRGLVKNGESRIILRDLDSVVMQWSQGICLKAVKCFSINSRES